MDGIRMQDGRTIPPGSILRNWKFDSEGNVIEAGTIETPEDRNVMEALKRIETRLSRIEAHLGIE